MCGPDGGRGRIAECMMWMLMWASQRRRAVWTVRKAWHGFSRTHNQRNDLTCSPANPTLWRLHADLSCRSGSRSGPILAFVEKCSAAYAVGLRATALLPSLPSCSDLFGLRSSSSKVICSKREPLKLAERRVVQGRGDQRERERERDAGVLM